MATGGGGHPGGCVDADVTVRDYMRGGTPPSHRLDPGIGPNDLLLLLVLTLLRRVMNDLHLLWLQWLLLLLLRIGKGDRCINIYRSWPSTTR